MKKVVVGNRIPYEFFTVCGVGESDISTHAGSFHLALADAGIECYNIVNYSSILPRVATEVVKPGKYVHGSVLETIMARVDGVKGQRLTAGIEYGWLVNSNSGKRYGGLVVEYMEHGTEQEAKMTLDVMLNELYDVTDKKKFTLMDRRTIVKSFVPEKKYGTALVALGFVSYILNVKLL